MTLKPSCIRYNCRFIKATVSAQGIVRIYEAADVMDLSRWSLCHELQVSPFASVENTHFLMVFFCIPHEKLYCDADLGKLYFIISKPSSLLLQCPLFAKEVHEIKLLI